jgi:hypothetical protein
LIKRLDPAPERTHRLRTDAILRQEAAKEIPMAEILCVLYPDPETGYPPRYARDAIPTIAGHPPCL